MALAATGGALAVAGLATGVGFTVAAKGKASDVSRLHSGQPSACYAPAPSMASTCSALHDAVSKHATFSNVAAFGFIVGGVSTLAATGLGIWAATSPNPPPIRIVPSVGTTSVGLTLQGIL